MPRLPLRPLAVGVALGLILALAGVAAFALQPGAPASQGSDPDLAPAPFDVADRAFVLCWHTFLGKKSLNTDFSLAELAALRLPALLVPFPAAADNHQFYNARAFEATGAARLFEQKGATPETVAAAVVELIENRDALFQMRAALAQWHAPKAAEQIAENILRVCRSSRPSLPVTVGPKPEFRPSRSRQPEQEHFSVA